MAKYYDATSKNASEPNGAMVNGIFRAGIVKGTGSIVTTGNTTVITGATYSTPLPSVAEFGANPNGTFPILATRPSMPSKGSVQYDPSTNELRNNKTGRKSAVQGQIIYLGRSRVRDTGSGKIYTVINTPLGGPI